MRKIVVLICALLMTFSYGFAQRAAIKGNITDTSSKENLSNAVISILRSKDSVLYKFTRSNAQGKFSLGHLPAGKFILLVTYPKYADYVEQLTLTDSSDITYNKISLILKAKLLEEVVIKQKISAIKIKGDTTEFTADSFHVQANATVEDLLKKLPGIQIDKNGKITAQGETVQKVLVDGEEFFGDDPTLVTQNLRADMIDKVQVFDKKSDQAAFTGIDDGEKSKTINLKLKDNKKNGYFGKVNVGGGTDGYYDNQLMINLFKKKKKLSAYGIMSNTGKTGLNWNERNSYGDNIASNVDFDDASGNLMFTGSSDELDSWDGQYNGQGYPSVKTGGIHYNNKWDDDKQSANFNYKILQLNVTGANGTNTQYILPDTLYYNSQRETFNNQILRNRINGNYELQLDSSSSIKISASGGTDHKVTESHFITEARASDSALVNTGERNITTTGDTRTVNSNLLWKKKLRKKGRTISVNLSENYENGTSDGFLYADNEFYKGGISYQQQITDQYKKYSNKKLLFDSKITYSEPLSPVSSLIANYGVTVNNSESNRQSFNKSPDGNYTAIDSAYSNEYRFNIFTHKAGLTYNLIKKKVRFNIGNNLGITNFKQQDLLTDISARRNFINWAPQTSFMYSFNQQKRLSLRYNGYTSQPSIQQIQPIRSNDDPLNIVIGNPDLKPQFSNNINLSFSQYKVLTETNIYVSLSYRFTENAIGNNSAVDYTTGKRTSQSVNLDGNHGISGYFGYGFKWKKPGIHINFNGQISQGTNAGIVNNVLNITKNGNYTLSTYLYKSKDKKYELRLEGSATYTNSRSSVQNNIKTNYWTYNIQPSFDFFLPKKFQLHSDVDANFRQKTSAFDFNTNVILWNAWFGKKFLKGDVLLLKASANDLLNQNVGFRRDVNSNYISQNTYSSIQRFFMLSLVWNFTKAGTPPPPQN
jgi:Outer membrane protein beta-barrel family/Carboxypeptidase regulatory-like domain